VPGAPFDVGVTGPAITEAGSMPASFFLISLKTIKYLMIFQSCAWFLGRILGLIAEIGNQ
jgi:hypothetical protein